MSVLTCGIDVGSSAVKVAVLSSPPGSGRERHGATVLATSFDRIRKRDQREVVDAVLEDALRLAGASRGDLGYVATTGEGEMVEDRTGHFYGMTAHARGALFLDPDARAVLDVGALHARAMVMDERARVLGYDMTSQCASGSGQFLENVARYLGVTLDEIGPLSLEGQKPEKVSGICAVLAETDVINMVSRGISLANILSGIHESMAVRLGKLLRKLKFTRGVVLFTGGLAADVGLRAQTAKALTGLPVEVRADPASMYAGAIGAALWGAYRKERLAALTHVSSAVVSA